MPRWRLMGLDTGALVAARVAGIYTLLGLAWIVSSDRALPLLGFGDHRVAWAQTVKGGAFVVGSALVIYGLLRLELARRARAELELERHRQALVAADKLALLGRLAAGVAHELRNPLTVLTGRLGLLRDQAEQAALPAPVMRSLASLEDATGRMQRIVDGLLVYSRPSKAVAGAVLVDDVIANVRQFVGLEAVARNVTIETDVVPDLPPVLADRGQLVQILVNLATNAIDAAAGAGGGTLVLRAHAAGDHVVLEVADTGPGIPPEVLERIWEPFFTTKTEGTGLGLAIVRSLVAAQPGAAISAESTPGQGARFRMTMPVATQET